MSVIRILLVLLILVGLASLTLQNLSPSISLVFLGARSQPIPLSFLIWGAIAAGVTTGLLILALLKLSQQLSGRQLQSRIRELEGAQAPFGAGTRTQQTRANGVDADEPGGSSNEASSYEAEQPTKTGYQSGSTYSYSYRDSNRSGAGRRESVVDAEYREVTPAPQPQANDSGFDDEDFDFDEEDYPPEPRR